MRSKGTSLAVLSACVLLACGPSEPSREQARSRSAESQPASETLDLFQDAPDSILVQLRRVMQTTDEARPGASVAALQAFLEEHSGYETDDVVQDQIERLSALADERYHEARELAREGSFEEAESILRDLATYLPDTSGGQKAADHLVFDFSFGRAQYYLVQERFDEAADVARRLLQRDLTVEQAQQTEQLLDRLAQIDAVMRMAERHNAQAEVRQITVALMMAFVEEGRFPDSLTLDRLEDSPYYTGAPRFIASIEGYRATADNVSFTAVTRSGHRIRVVNGQILD
jgi:tetratricopeptide (TPR) repeat protein